MKENETVQLTKERTELLEDKQAEYFLQKNSFFPEGKPSIYIQKDNIFGCKEPYIPDGFEYIKGDWDKNFTIRNNEDGSEFVAVPVEALEANGTLDGVHFCEKFGRRKCFRYSGINKGFFEPVDYELWESIKKYGVFYISAYLASFEHIGDYSKLVFKKGNEPFCIKDSEYVFEEGNAGWISEKGGRRNVLLRQGFFELATNYAKSNTDINCCLPNGAVYDTIFQWIVQSEDKSYDEIMTGLSEKWGNFWSKYRDTYSCITLTGSNEEWSACGIYDLAGNCSELSRERMVTHDEKTFYVERGGCCSLEAYAFSPTDCQTQQQYQFCYPRSFRTVLYKNK